MLSCLPAAPLLLLAFGAFDMRRTRTVTRAVARGIFIQRAGIGARAGPLEHCTDVVKRGDYDGYLYSLLQGSERRCARIVSIVYHVLSVCRVAVLCTRVELVRCSSYSMRHTVVWTALCSNRLVNVLYCCTVLQQQQTV